MLIHLAWADDFDATQGGLDAMLVGLEEAEWTGAGLSISWENCGHANCRYTHCCAGHMRFAVPEVEDVLVATFQIGRQYDGAWDMVRSNCWQAGDSDPTRQR